MLDQTTKRKIDSARDILVGKVPDPKAQVEQITTALIYKFMDDMDRESEELGGKASFFSNGYEKYAWRNVIDKRFSGQERLNLYVEAITNMSKNPHLPPLFRDIFKDAFLPYRDPETLSLFLKEIDGFTYEHSENLGNAFEYLLSVLGSQGSAGQFRTPRHIIDFIVEVVDPKKNETVLDPACGTAGFLISAYKHILKHNSSNYKPEKETAADVIKEGDSAAETVLQEAKKYTGDLLSPESKTKLMQNIEGYDISPDMVKLSLVNLYLHGFSGPKVYEYDTLTSEKRWGEQFDVIMANPPFMTPKGGIRPHKRFSVQANRSEVLFVDYILEHLNINGRAGIIVPEGIIFQSSNAYKELRRFLIEDGLFAVVSLPPGVFNPYSGVKTSILLFDKTIAKQTDKMLFVKIENDGFDLGAQRRKIDKNDLPPALEIIKEWKSSFVIPDSDRESIVHLVPKSKILESSDYNLTGDRYKEIEIIGNQKWPMVELGDVAKFKQGKQVDKDLHLTEKKEGYSRFIRIIDYTQENEDVRYIPTPNADVFCNEKELIMVRYGRPGLVGRGISGVFANNLFKIDFQANPNIDLDYAYFILNSKIIQNYINRNLQIAGLPAINHSIVKKIKIPLPPIEAQKEIVAQIEVKQAAIDAAREVIKNLERERRYFGQELRKLEAVEWIELGHVAEVISGQSPESKYYNANDEGLPFYQGKTEFTEMYIDKPNTWTTKTTKIAEKGDILMSVRAPVGPVNIATQKICIGRGLAAIRPNKAEPIFLFNFLKSIEDQIKGSGGAVFDSINRGQIEKIKIPLPPLEIQKQLVEEAEKEEEIITANRKLIQLMVSKINNIISDLWGETNG